MINRKRIKILSLFLLLQFIAHSFLHFELVDSILCIDDSHQTTVENISEHTKHHTNNDIKLLPEHYSIENQCKDIFLGQTCVEELIYSTTNTNPTLLFYELQITKLLKPAIIKSDYSVQTTDKLFPLILHHKTIQLLI